MDNIGTKEVTNVKKKDQALPSPQPYIGQKIYINTRISLSHGEDDFLGGICKICSVVIGKGPFFIEVREHEGVMYSYGKLLDMQQQLSQRFAKQKERRKASNNIFEPKAADEKDQPLPLPPSSRPSPWQKIYIDTNGKDSRVEVCTICGIFIPKGSIIIEVKENKGKWYSWEEIYEKQADLKAKFGKKRGRKIPDLRPQFNEGW